MKEFIGRSKELSQLEKAYSNGMDLILITGRRRVGKTRMIQEFIRDKDSIYYLATNTNERDMMDGLWECLKDSDPSIKGSPRDWKDVFTAIADGRRKVLVIDEFSYIVRADPGFLVRFQGIYDTILKGSGVMTILCGSHLSIMNSLSEDEDSPLYGRFDRRIVLQPLGFHEIPSSGDIRYDIERYAIHGGVPRYMELLSEDSVREDVEHNVMDPRSMMFSDPIVLLERDVGPSSTYLSIVKAIANGNHRITEISSAVEMQSGALGPYLNRLTEIGLICKEVPVTEHMIEKSKKGRYFVSDKFTSFWFRFVYPYRSDLALDRNVYAMSRFDTDFIQRHVSFVYEDICRDLIRRDCGMLSFTPERVGRYWSKDVEIDIVAIDTMSKKAFAGECKYSTSPVDMHVLNELKGKVEKVHELKGYDVEYGLFSVSGFTEDVENSEVILFGPEALGGS